MPAKKKKKTSDDDLESALRDGPPRRRRVAALDLGNRDPNRARRVLDELAEAALAKGVTERRLVDELRVLAGLDEAIANSVPMDHIELSRVPPHALVRLLADAEAQLERGAPDVDSVAFVARLDQLGVTDPAPDGFADPASRYGLAGEPTEAVVAARHRLRERVVRAPSLSRAFRSRVATLLMDESEAAAALVLAGHALAPLEPAPVWRAVASTRTRLDPAVLREMARAILDAGTTREADWPATLSLLDARDAAGLAMRAVDEGKDATVFVGVAAATEVMLARLERLSGVDVVRVLDGVDDGERMELLRAQWSRPDVRVALISSAGTYSDDEVALVLSSLHELDWLATFHFLRKHPTERGRQEALGLIGEALTSDVTTPASRNLALEAVRADGGNAAVARAVSELLDGGAYDARIGGLVIAGWSHGDASVEPAFRRALARTTVTTPNVIVDGLAHLRRRFGP